MPVITDAFFFQAIKYLQHIIGSIYISYLNGIITKTYNVPTISPRLATMANLKHNPNTFTCIGIDR